MLAQAYETVSAPGALPGELRFQPKFDGYRSLVFTPWPASGPLPVQSRRGSLRQSRFPDLVDAAVDLSDGLILDGELVVWAEEAMSFEALQRRAVSGGRTAARLAQEVPAHFIAFDVLHIDGQELLHVPYDERRAQLEQLFTDRSLGAPWTLCPETTEVAAAKEWLMSWTQAPGVEGLVIRGSGQRYLPGAARCTRCAAATPPRRYSLSSRCVQLEVVAAEAAPRSELIAGTPSATPLMGPLTECGLPGNRPRGLWPAGSAASEGSDDPSGVAPLVGVEGAAGVDDLGAGWRVSSASSTAVIGSST
ncbi:ATP-dependent DNA ligase [Streptomyces kanasensis]|uniref:ATP-dependent DNA ligase n=1 Tax=Streptomyces kanasensis TaxID=936756 RepID=UPI0038027F35